MKAEIVAIVHNKTPPNQHSHIKKTHTNQVNEHILHQNTLKLHL